MFKTVSVRLDAPKYRLLKKMAEEENRTLSNYIETVSMRYLEEHESVEGFEMAEIRANQDLNASLRRGTANAQARKGRFVE